MATLAYRSFKYVGNAAAALIQDKLGGRDRMVGRVGSGGWPEGEACGAGRWPTGARK